MLVAAPLTLDWSKECVGDRHLIFLYRKLLGTLKDQPTWKNRIVGTLNASNEWHRFLQRGRGVQEDESMLQVLSGLS